MSIGTYLTCDQDVFDFVKGMRRVCLNRFRVTTQWRGTTVDMRGTLIEAQKFGWGTRQLRGERFHLCPEHYQRPNERT